MECIPQSVTKRVALKAYLSSDHVSAATGKTIAVVLSKNGAAFANPSGGATNATEIANGWYYVDLSTTDTGTAGPLIVRGTVSAVDDVETGFTVVDAHNAGFDGVPSAVAAASGGLPTVDSTNSVKIQSGLKKNTALASFEFQMLDSTGAPATGLTIAATRSIDGAAYGACTNSAAEVANGTYKLNLAAGDLNGNVIGLRFTATGAVDTNIYIVTQP